MKKKFPASANVFFQNRHGTSPINSTGTRGRMFFFGSAAAMLIALTAGVSGCTSIRELPREKQIAEPATPEHQLCRELLMCVLRNDASGFQKRLSPESQRHFDLREFKNTRKALNETLGEPVSFQYLTTLEFMALSPHIWKIRFRRENKQRKEIFSEALFRIVTGKAADGTIIVLGFNFL